MFFPCEKVATEENMNCVPDFFLIQFPRERLVLNLFNPPPPPQWCLKKCSKSLKESFMKSFDPWQNDMTKFKSNQVFFSLQNLRTSKLRFLCWSAVTLIFIKDLKILLNITKKQEEAVVLKPSAWKFIHVQHCRT